jgi:hypothetical protein
MAESESHILGLKGRGIQCLMKSRRVPCMKLGGRVCSRLDRVMQVLDGFEIKAMRLK